MQYRSLIVTAIICLGVFLLSRCMNKGGEKSAAIENINGEQFVGSAVCATCHKSIYDTHVSTAHYLTSKPGAEKFIKGSFESGKNFYAYNGSVAIVMEKRDSGLYQVEYFRDTEKKAKQIDIVIGSGTMGQSFANWRGNNLFQLPITYFTAAHQWSNSPGFPDRIYFNRPITSRCLECHATYAKVISNQEEEPEEFSRTQIMYGVDCEKCHGPAAKHVEFETQANKSGSENHIINPAKFLRQQSLDLCASCHAGRLQKTKPSFEFTAGNRLSDYFIVDTAQPDPATVDVHGNQYGLLRASKCFKMSEITCVTCHNTHENEKGKIAVFSQRCITCHNDAHATNCPLAKKLGKSINANCIDCHMPLKTSKAIAVQLHGDSVPTAAFIRSHFIKIYPEETKRLLSGFKNVKGS